MQLYDKYFCVSFDHIFKITIKTRGKISHLAIFMHYDQIENILPKLKTEYKQKNAVICVWWRKINTSSWRLWYVIKP